MLKCCVALVILIIHILKFVAMRIDVVHGTLTTIVSRPH